MHMVVLNDVPLFISEYRIRGMNEIEREKINGPKSNIERKQMDERWNRKYNIRKNKSMYRYHNRRSMGKIPNDC